MSYSPTIVLLGQSIRYRHANVVLTVNVLQMCYMAHLRSQLPCV